VLRDIRELTSEQEAYAAELRRRWGGLLSYRYIGRTWASMDLGPVDDIVTLRHDMRNATGGVLLAVLGIAAPEGGGMSDLEAVPNPVIHSCQILDPGRDVRRIEVVSEVLKRGRQMSYSRSRIVDADDPSRVLALTEGQGISIGDPPEGLEKMEVEPIDVVDSPICRLGSVRRRRRDAAGGAASSRPSWPRRTRRSTSGRSSSSWRRLRSTSRPASPARTASRACRRT
jgi:hypothetical protein